MYRKRAAGMLVGPLCCKLLLGLYHVTLESEGGSGGVAMCASPCEGMRMPKARPCAAVGACVSGVGGRDEPDRQGVLSRAMHLFRVLWREIRNLWAVDAEGCHEGRVIVAVGNPARTNCGHGWGVWRKASVSDTGGGGTGGLSERLFFFRAERRLWYR